MPTSLKGRLFQDTVIRIDSLGFPWLMDRPEEGWHSSGLRFRTIHEITAQFAVRLGTPGSDQFSDIIPVIAL